MVAARALRLRAHVRGRRRAGVGPRLLPVADGAGRADGGVRAAGVALDVQLAAGGRASGAGLAGDLRGRRLDEAHRPHPLRTSPPTQDILKELAFEVHLIHEGLVAKTMLEMYDEEAIILEPAGALSVAGLEAMREQIEGKTVICILSGSNNDISRLPEVRTRSLIYENKQAYYMLSSPSSRTPLSTQSTFASSSK